MSDKKRALAHCIAAIVTAHRNCIERPNGEWQARWSAAIGVIEREHLPSGSGIDAGTTIDLSRTNASRLVFKTSFHHMNEGGYYDGWTEHTVCALAEFDGIAIKVSGRDRNGIKEYLADTFHQALTSEIDFDSLLSAGAP